MIKITYNSNDTYINDYVLSKQIEELGISTTCNTNVRFEKPTFNDLLQSTLVGADADDIDIEITCGGATEQFDAYIDHREGKFNLKTCVADKKINFKVPYECLRTSNGNIFHSKPKVTKTIQGTLIRESYTGITHVTYPDDYTPTLQEMISLFPIPIKPDFHAEYMEKK